MKYNYHIFAEEMEHKVFFDGIISFYEKFDSKSSYPDLKKSIIEYITERKNIDINIDNLVIRSMTFLGQDNV